MLEILRTASKTWVFKGLLILLVVSFGIWGARTSIVQTGSDAVVTVGDVKVSPGDFRLAYERQVAQLSRQFGTRLTREQARAFGVEAQVYSQLVAGATLDQLSDDMSLGLSQDRLAALIAEDPAFHGVNGQFDRLTFSSVLRNAGLREQDYINNRSQVAVRSQVVEALSDGYAAPKFSSTRCASIATKRVTSITYCCPTPISTRSRPRPTRCWPPGSKPTRPNTAPRNSAGSPM